MKVASACSCEIFSKQDFVSTRYITSLDSGVFWKIVQDNKGCNCHRTIFNSTVFWLPKTRKVLSFSRRKLSTPLQKTREIQTKFLGGLHPLFPGQTNAQKQEERTKTAYYIQLPNQWLPSPVLHPYRCIIDKLLRPEGPQRNSAPIISSPIFQPPTFRVSSGQPSSSNANSVDGQFGAESFRYPETVSGSVPKFGDREPKSLNMYLPLYRAALKGDWEQAKWFLNRHPGAECTKITKGCETALHIAAGARHTKFVEELVNKISANDLELKNKDGNTALCFAAASGITWIAEVMVNKNINLPRIRGSRGVTPLYMAALLGHRDMVWYLYSVTGDEYLKLEDFFALLVAAISSDLYDFALYILGRHPHLAIRYDRNRETALHVLARKPSAFASGSRLGIWERGIYPWIHVELPNKSKCGSNSSRSQASVNNYDGPPLTGLLWLAIKLRVPGIKAIYEKKLSHMQALELVKCLCKEVMSQVDSQIGDSFIISSKTLFIATEFGIVEFVAELISSYPEFIWMVDDENRSLFHIAVMYRRAKIYSLIYSIGAHKDLITSYKDRGDNNMLHLAGKLAPSYLLNVVSGPALQMHRELLWFKVKTYEPILYSSTNNNSIIVIFISS
ncbi:hypothetical protein F0562_030781 [Nyssa sinensis]|uniref:Uncharacterized protein n=1 Tax=Nyssa sinensis TaxID=561372 RepID=A0A5J5AXE1_9ASTE|nr:hypothetical protein F0562_030781 [Nyssa sinensis]